MWVIHVIPKNAPMDLHIWGYLNGIFFLGGREAVFEAGKIKGPKAKLLDKKSSQGRIMAPRTTPLKTTPTINNGLLRGY